MQVSSDEQQPPGDHQLGMCASLSASLEPSSSCLLRHLLALVIHVPWSAGWRLQTCRSTMGNHAGAHTKATHSMVLDYRLRAFLSTH